MVCHSNVICVCTEILRGGHDGELDGPLVAECFVGPFSNGTNLLDGGNTVVGNQDLRDAIVSFIFLPEPCTPLVITYVCDNGMTIVSSDKVLHLGLWRIFQLVATNEVVGNLAQLGVSCLAILVRHQTPAP